VNGWLFATLRGAGLELTTISLATVPLAFLWVVLAIALGRAQERRARDITAIEGAPPTKPV
jgi:preprotein translocase subunit SecG